MKTPEENRSAEADIQEAIQSTKTPEPTSKKPLVKRLAERKLAWFTKKILLKCYFNVLLV